MELDQARELASKFRSKAEQLDTPTPKEQFENLVSRVESLPNGKETTIPNLGIIIKEYHIQFDDTPEDLELDFMTIRFPDNDGTEGLLNVAAKWHVGENALTTEDITSHDVAETKNAPASLLLIEESVTAAENEVARKAAQNTPLQKI